MLAAKFADSTDTAALSLYGSADTPDEIKYHKEHMPRFWVEYHPVLDDTLIGMMIFAADGMLVDAKPERLRDITQSFTNRKTYFGEVPRFNNNKSLSASTTLKKMITKHYVLRSEHEKLSTYLGKQIIEFEKIKKESKKVKFAMTLKDDINRFKQIQSDYKKYKWSTYMMNDVSSNFRFNIDNGILNIDGAPNYHFGVSEGKNFTETYIVTNLLIKNRSLLNDLNPFIYSSVDKFSKLVSFFNYVEKNDPNEWKSFILELRNKDFSLPVIDTPAAWNPS